MKFLTENLPILRGKKSGTSHPRSLLANLLCPAFFPRRIPPSERQFCSPVGWGTRTHGTGKYVRSFISDIIKLSRNETGNRIESKLNIDLSKRTQRGTSFLCERMTRRHFTRQVSHASLSIKTTIYILYIQQYSRYCYLETVAGPT